jgi:hypothetical protein
MWDQVVQDRKTHLFASPCLVLKLVYNGNGLLLQSFFQIDTDEWLSLFSFTEKLSYEV